MDIFYYANFFSIIMIIINFVFTSVSIFDFSIRIPVISTDTIYIPQGLRNTIDNVQSKMMSYGNPILIFFIILYIIFYLIYLAIKTLVPDTGFPTFFIPIKEILLAIPPLPTLERYGIFRLIECVVKSFGIKPALEGFIKFNLCFVDFSRDNIRTILRTFFPDLEIDLDSGKPLESSEKSTKPENEVKNKVYEHIDKEVNICYKKNRKLMKIGMSETQKARIEFDNNQTYIKCKANSIGKYIRI
jgi:hypothetical protein